MIMPNQPMLDLSKLGFEKHKSGSWQKRCNNASISVYSYEGRWMFMVEELELDSAGLLALLRHIGAYEESA